MYRSLIPALVLFAVPQIAFATEVRLFFNPGSRPAVEKLVPQFESATAIHVVTIMDVSAALKRRQREVGLST